MTQATARDRFYAPLRKVARDYLPLLLARMRILEQRSATAIDYLEDEADPVHEVIWTMDDKDRISNVVAAQTDLHKSVLEASTLQQLVGAFADLLQEDYSKIRDNGCYYIGPDGQYVSLYAAQDLPKPKEDDDNNGVKS